METSSIAGVLSQIPLSRAKLYQRVYDVSGYELGFGRSGVYSGHAHLHFCDLMFSPTGIATTTQDGLPVRGRLVIVPPRTYFGETRIGDFFFIKFSPHPGEIVVPDKVDRVLTEGVILAFEDSAEVQLDWFAHPTAACVPLRIKLAGKHLTVEFGQRDAMKVGP